MFVSTQLNSKQMKKKYFLIAVVLCTWAAVNIFTSVQKNAALIFSKRSGIS